MGVFHRLAMHYLEMPSHQIHQCALPAGALLRPNAGAWCTVVVPAPGGLSTVRPATRASQNHSCFRSNNTGDADYSMIYKHWNVLKHVCSLSDGDDNVQR